jgi:hypothetical protein
MSNELTGLIAERNEARIVFIRARFHRDAASVFYDSVVTESATVTQPAWDAFSTKQREMDCAGDHLILACESVVSHIFGGAAVA